MECLGLESPEDKTVVIDACQTRMKYLGKVQSMRGWPEFTFTDKPVGIQIRAEKIGEDSVWVSNEVLTAATCTGGSRVWSGCSGVLQKLLTAYICRNTSGVVDRNFFVVRGEEGCILSGRDSVFVYISSRVGIRFCNAVLGMGRGIFMSVLLRDNSLAKTGT